MRVICCVSRLTYASSARLSALRWNTRLGFQLSRCGMSQDSLMNTALRRWHRRLGLLLFLPCLAWGLSGAILAWKNWARPRPPDLAAVTGRRTPFALPPEEALRLAGGQPRALRWTWLLATPRYVVEYDDAPPVRIDGLRPLRLPPVDETLARRIAEAAAGTDRVRGCAQLRDGVWLLRHGPEEGPLWRCDLDGGDAVYVDEGGEVVRVGALYRLIRFAFLGLHTWDLSTGTGAHASYLFLLAAALCLVALCLSGLALWLPRRRRA